MLKLIANPGEDWSQRELGDLLFISPGEINKSIKRLSYAALLRQSKSNPTNLMPILAVAKEYFIHGVKYSFPARLGGYVPGITTGFAAPVFKGKIVLGEDPVPVWPCATGDVKGLALKPLYTTVPRLIQKRPDQALYDLLALVDAIRCGRARERNIAIKLLMQRIDYESAKQS